MTLYYILLGIVLVTGAALFIMLIVKLIMDAPSRSTSFSGEGRKSKRPRFRSIGFYTTGGQDNSILENGYSRKDYTDAGFSDGDIETWGLDQPGAPDPLIAPVVIADMSDGKLDGEFHFPFS